MWIWQREDFPNFKWDNKELKDISNENYYLYGQLNGIPNLLTQKEIDELQATFITDDILTSFEIEGETLQRESVRDSILKRFDLTQRHKTDKYKIISNLYADLAENIDISLSIEQINQWHEKLFFERNYQSIKIGQLRGSSPMQIVSGRIGNETIHYEAPPRDKLESLYQDLIDFINKSSSDGAWLKSALTHLWFEIIHPYEDGNGRIGRLLADRVITQEVKSNNKLFSMSQVLLDKKEDYYMQLEHASKGTLDITAWLKWYLLAINSSLKQSFKTINTIVSKSKFWRIHAKSQLNKNQIKVLNKMWEKPELLETGINYKKYISITGTSRTTAHREIQSLVENKIFKVIADSSEKKVRYTLA
jgi:Fic family protein